MSRSEKIRDGIARLRDAEIPLFNRIKKEQGRAESARKRAALLRRRAARQRGESKRAGFERRARDLDAKRLSAVRKLADDYADLAKNLESQVAQAERLARAER
ncbi:hypothetical protein [Flindersiella endophytica]